ncbi:ATP-dependent zinc protease [Parahaliea sp. F7430]|uniref:ATP-dependent zinc protease n=1 Tax=Sediminihaliea albiluteola TaxID=2758564 RepID=A0A7W2YIS9_9GAMM|nr:RimK/LysX family protein [Sediminihaliea albiluteola]MBA6411859.1 ATP-dependent zinc protease [Sediminihaliea albiluteola]
MVKRRVALVAVFTLLALAGCSVVPELEPVSEQVAPLCPPVPVQECAVCEAKACPATVVVERVVEKPVPAAVALPTTAGELNLPIIGAVEWATVEPPGLRLEARIDTGTETTTMLVANIRQLEKDGKRYVLFDLRDPESGDSVEVESALQRKTVLKRSTGPNQTRYVVSLWVSIGEHRSLIDVSLTERHDDDYALIIGRNFLTDVAIVDVSRRHQLN